VKVSFACATDPEHRCVGYQLTVDGLRECECECHEAMLLDVGEDGELIVAPDFPFLNLWRELF